MVNAEISVCTKAEIREIILAAIRRSWAMDATGWSEADEATEEIIELLTK